MRKTSMRLLHFTPYLSRWGFNDKPTIVTGFLSRILTQGFLPNSNFGCLEEFDINYLRRTFIHHGIRANKKKVNGNFCLPCAIVVDTSVHTFVGYDDPSHRVTTVAIPPKDIIGWFVFKPDSFYAKFMLASSKDFASLVKDAVSEEYSNYTLNLMRTIS